MSDKKPYLVGVSGGSASGKTYLLHQLMRRIPSEQITLISQDNYYKDLEFQNLKEDGTVNFDHPDALDLIQFTKDIRRLLNGESITIREYTFNNPRAVPVMLTYHPSPIIVVEGLFIYYKPEMRNLLDLKVFVDADEHIKLSRRILRDYAERGYRVEDILAQYEKDVIPMYNMFVKPHKDSCDLIIPNNYHMGKAIEVLLDHLMVKAR
jgi:uridine kinase